MGSASLHIYPPFNTVCSNFFYLLNFTKDQISKYKKMSWDAYVDSLKQRGMVGGAICGLDGSWFVASDGSKITLDELKSILNNYGKDNVFHRSQVRRSKIYVPFHQRFLSVPTPLQKGSWRSSFRQIKYNNDGWNLR